MLTYKLLDTQEISRNYKYKIVFKVIPCEGHYQYVCFILLLLHVLVLLTDDYLSYSYGVDARRIYSLVFLQYSPLSEIPSELIYDFFSLFQVQSIGRLEVVVCGLGRFHLSIHLTLAAAILHIHCKVDTGPSVCFLEV